MSLNERISVLSDFLPTRNETERTVRGFFAKALKCDPESIDVEESLFNMGGHSLMATLVVAAIRREMGMELSMAAFFRKPTVRNIASILVKQSTVFEASLQHEDGGPLLNDSTILANTDHPGPYLFLFPESVGMPSVYSTAFSTLECKVVAFGDDRWGQQVDPNLDTIENMSRNYVEQILSLQSEGDYYLAGWSFGGYLALEVARQLEGRGKKVKMVIMADSSIWDEHQPPAKWRPALDHLLSVIDDKNAWLSQFNRVNDMIARYRISKGVYKGRVVLIKALRGRDVGVAGPREDPFNGWREYLPQVEVRAIDATHRGMFDSGNGPLMGTIISREIAEVDGSLSL